MRFDPSSCHTFPAQGFFIIGPPTSDMADDELLPGDMTAAELNTLWARWSSQGLFDDSFEIDSWTSFSTRIPQTIQRQLEED